MGKARIDYAVLKQMASDSSGMNPKCFSGLCELIDKDRDDIVLNIKKLQQSDPYKYTPTLFATWLSDVDALIKRYDSIYNPRTVKEAYSTQDYVEKKLAYDVGESNIDPDAR